MFMLKLRLQNGLYKRESARSEEGKHPFEMRGRTKCYQFKHSDSCSLPQNRQPLCRYLIQITSFLFSYEVANFTNL